MKWKPIETMPDDFEGHALLYGKRYGRDDTEQQINQEDDEYFFYGYQTEHDGHRYFASTETYHGSERWYVRPTLWAEFSLPDKE